MKLSPISACALSGGIASIYGLSMSLISLVTGLFEQDLSALAANAQSATAIMARQGMAHALTMRMVEVSAAALVLFLAIAYLDRRAEKASQAATASPL
jgi:hypothetical protein